MCEINEMKVWLHKAINNPKHLKQTHNNNRKMRWMTRRRRKRRRMDGAWLEPEFVRDQPGWLVFTKAFMSALGFLTELHSSVG